MWLTIVNERKRTQPIVMSNEAKPRRLEKVGDESVWQGHAYLTSEGGGPAFNVQFGVEYRGVRYGQRLSPEDPPSGNVQRVLKPDERRPAQGSWPVVIDSLHIFGAGAQGDPEPTTIYWARYENAYGKTWETRNPGDRSSRLGIRRVRFRRLHEFRERRRRNRARKHGVAWERKIVSELSFQGSLEIEKSSRDEPDEPATDVAHIEEEPPDDR